MLKKGKVIVPGMSLLELKGFNYQKVAKAIVVDALGIGEGENVIVETWNHGLDLAREVIYLLRQRGANPMLLIEDEEAYWRTVTTIPESIGRVGSHEWNALAKTDAYIFIRGPVDSAQNRGLDPTKVYRANAYNDEWYERAYKAGVRGVRVDLAFVTPGRAKQMGYNYTKWGKMMTDAASADLSLVKKKSEKLGKLLSGNGRAEVTASNGTNLSFKLRGAKPLFEIGVLTKDDLNDKARDYSNMTTFPGGRVLVLTDEKSAKGKVSFDGKAFLYGRLVEDLTWTFKNGKLASYTGGKNVEVFDSRYKESRGDKDRIGWLAIGVNPKMSYGFMNEGFVEGAVTIGIGWGGEETRNKTSFFCSSTLFAADLTIGGKKVIKAGKIQI